MRQQTLDHKAETLPGAYFPVTPVDENQNGPWRFGGEVIDQVACRWPNRLWPSLLEALRSQPATTLAALNDIDA